MRFDPTRRRFVELGWRAGLALPALAATGYGALLLAGDEDPPVKAPANAAPPLRAADFGVGGDGRTDDTRALQAAVDAAAGRTLSIAGMCRTSGEIMLRNGSSIQFAPESGLVASRGDYSLLKASGCRGVVIRGGRFRGAAGNAAYVGGVLIESSTDCAVLDCTFEAMQWAGVYLENSDRCTISGNRFRNARPSPIDSSDICVYKNSSHNIVRRNMSESGAHVGVLIQDPGGKGLYAPRYNIVTENRLTGNSVYGICLYVGGTSSHCRIEGNAVSGVTGADYASGGAGIYCVGEGLGGTIIRGNRVSDCCRTTRDRLNGPAGVSVGGFGGRDGAPAPVVEGNGIDAMSQGDGIHIVSCAGGASLGANEVRMPRANSGKGPGGLTLAGNALRIQNSSGVTVTGGRYATEGRGDSVLVLATAVRMRGVSLDGVSSHGAASPAIRTAVESGFALAALSIQRCRGSTAAGTNAIQLQGIDGGLVADNHAETAERPPLMVSDCRRTRFSGNRLRSGGTALALFSGDCSGSRFSPDPSMPAAGLANQSHGLVIGPAA